jgi:hypothetical protein
MQDYIFFIAPIAGWIIAQFIKIVLDLRKDGIHIKDAIASGGMPSAHTTGIVALTTVIGRREGIESAIFGLSLAITVIIIYDAVGVRRATGENTVAIAELAKKMRLAGRTHVLMARGHTPNEVFAGIILGIAIGSILIKIL